ncbi:hypothetical protein [Segatella sp.]
MGIFISSLSVPVKQVLIGVCYGVVRRIRSVWNFNHAVTMSGYSYS